MLNQISKQNQAQKQTMFGAVAGGGLIDGPPDNAFKKKEHGAAGD